MERWAGQAVATGGVVRFLSLGDLCRLRRVSKGAASLAGGWFMHLQITVNPEQLLRSKGENTEENCSFLDSLDLATDHGAGICSLDFASIGACGVPKRVLYDRLLARVAVRGLDDHSLRALFVRRNVRETVAPWLKALPCFTGLRRLHLDVVPDISATRLLRMRLLTALRGRRFHELSFRPTDFAFADADFEAIPRSLDRLELRCDSDGGLADIKHWLAYTEPRGGCTQLRLVWEGHGTRPMSFWRFPEVLPSLERLALVCISPRTNYKNAPPLHFPRLRSLSVHCDTDWARLALQPDVMGVDKSNAAGANLVAFLRAFSAETQGGLQSLELIGEFGFSGPRDFDVLSQLSGLRSLGLDLLCTVRDRDVLKALKDCTTLQKLVNLERLSLLGLRDGAALVWPCRQRPKKSAREVMTVLLKRLRQNWPPGLRSVQLATREAGAVQLLVSHTPSPEDKRKLNQSIAFSIGKVIRALPPRESLSLDLAAPFAAEMSPCEVSALAATRWPRWFLAPLVFAVSEPPFPIAFHR